MSDLSSRARQLREELPPGIEIVAAAKTRSSQEVRQIIDAGIRTIGHNYVQEAQAMIEQLGRDAASWVMIGHLQRNKVKTAVKLFDGIHSVDSFRLAETIDRECCKIGRVMPILIEVNAERESQKTGVNPEDVASLVREISLLESIQIQGLMTMGPLVSDPNQLRPIFRETRRLLDRIAAAQIPGVSMGTLSMGMSSSYDVAIEEGSTMVRLGTTLFGPRT